MIYKYFKCPNCGGVFTAGEWNNHTLKFAKTDAAKKAFKGIQHCGKGQRWYACPKCGQHNFNISIKPILESDLPKVEPIPKVSSNMLNHKLKEFYHGTRSEMPNDIQGSGDNKNTEDNCIRGT